jgi:hypothetical protein
MKLGWWDQAVGQHHDPVETLVCIGSIQAINIDHDGDKKSSAKTSPAKATSPSKLRESSECSETLLTQQLQNMRARRFALER